jgi:hypothetical protein
LDQQVQLPQRVFLYVCTYRLGLIPLVSNDCKLLKKPFEATGEEGEVTDVVLSLDIKV